jgi:hypothetical protein
MPTYRIYYAEREARDQAALRDSPLAQTGGHSDAYTETEWEEQVEASDPVGALDGFFRERVRDNSELAWVDEDGAARPVEGVEYNPDLTYIWVEDGKLMEYQGFDEVTPGMVTCPLCNGHGEVEQALAEEFEEVWGEDEDAIDADVKG